MEYKITGYKPEKLFHFFEEISAIPRGSGNEKGISDYLVKFAEDRGLWVHQDEAHNVIIKKAGSKGAEDKASVMLQGLFSSPSFTTFTLDSFKSQSLP